MLESKIDLTDRLRREGRWADASKYKDEIVRKLRAEGKKRAEAAEQAWRETAEAYPRSTPGAVHEAVAGGVVDAEGQLFWDAASSDVTEWQQWFDVTLPDDALYSLVCAIMLPYWWMGQSGEAPRSVL